MLNNSITSLKTIFKNKILLGIIILLVSFILILWFGGVIYICIIISCLIILLIDKSHIKHFLFPFIGELILISLPLFLSEYRIFSSFFNFIEEWIGRAFLLFTGFIFFRNITFLFIPNKDKKSIKNSFLGLFAGIFVNFITFAWMFSRATW